MRRAGPSTTRSSGVLEVPSRVGPVEHVIDRVVDHVREDRCDPGGRFAVLSGVAAGVDEPGPDVGRLRLGLGDLAVFADVGDVHSVGCPVHGEREPDGGAHRGGVGEVVVVVHLLGSVSETEFGPYGATDMAEVDLEFRLFRFDEFLWGSFDAWVDAHAIGFIENPDMDALPDAVVDAALDIGQHWRFVNGWSTEVRAAPGIYSDVADPAFGVPVTLNFYFAVNPDLLLMDEPYGQLDVKLRFYLEDELVNLWQELKSTVLFVTHNIEEAVYVAERIIVFTPKPTKVKEEVVVDLPRPRDTLDPKFIAIRKHVTELIRWW